MNHRKIIYLMTFILGLFASLQSVTDASAGETLKSRMNACSQNSKDAVRLRCFDELIKSISEESVKDSSSREGLPENLGGGKFDDSRLNQIGDRGLVKSCKKSHDGKWFFIFENGQVWKQVDTDHRRYKECDFNVTIKKDGFGYKMQIDGQTRKIRIRRHR